MTDNDGAVRQKRFLEKPGNREINNKKQRARRAAINNLIAAHRAEYLKLYHEALKEVGVDQ